MPLQEKNTVVYPRNTIFSYQGLNVSKILYVCLTFKFLYFLKEKIHDHDNMEENFMREQKSTCQTGLRDMLSPVNHNPASTLWQKLPFSGTNDLRRAILSTVWNDLRRSFYPLPINNNQVIILASCLEGNGGSDSMDTDFFIVIKFDQRFLVFSFMF